MSTEWTVILTAIFLSAIPFNLWVRRKVRRLSDEPPPIATLTLLAQMVDILTISASALGVVATASVVFLLTGQRILPQPIGTVILVSVLLLISYGNLFVYRYLRRMRGHDA